MHIVFQKFRWIKHWIISHMKKETIFVYNFYFNRIYIDISISKILFTTMDLPKLHWNEFHDSFEKRLKIHWKNRRLRSISGEFHEETRYTESAHVIARVVSPQYNDRDLCLNRCCKSKVERTFWLCNEFSCRVSLAINFCHRTDTTVTLWQTRYLINL